MGLFKKDDGGDDAAKDQDRKIAELRRQRVAKHGPSPAPGAKKAQAAPAPTANRPASAPAPAPAPGATGSSDGMRSYTVKKGDTLSKISKEMLGKSGSWKHIYDVNRDTLEDPDKIYPGQTLRIPNQ